MRKQYRVLRLLTVIAALALVFTACTDDDSGTTQATTATTAATTTTQAATTTTAGDSGATTTTTQAATTTTEAATTTTAAPVQRFVYQTGIFQDTTTDNYWAYIDPNSTVWNAYVLGPTKPTLFSTNLPGLELDGDVAASADPGVATADGDGFSVTVAMRPDAVWSDGSPLTANDIVFTAETVRDFRLGGGWVSQYNWAQADDPETDADESEALGLTAVEAIDDNTVKFTWNKLPGLAVWPYQVGTASIMSQAFWSDVVEGARGSEDPAEVLYGASGVGDLSGGPTVFAEREAGAFARTVGNENYYATGDETTSGGATYVTGPYLIEQTFELYADQSAAVLALKAGEVDYLYNPLGLQRGLLDQITGDENLTPIVNATNGFRYLAFNLRREPMSIQGFRDAVAFMLDKEYITGSVLQGVAFPLYATVPEGNTSWYNEELADAWQASILSIELDTRWDGEPFVDGDGNPRTATGTEARLHAAAKALVDAGFSWPEGQGPDFANNAIVPGRNIMYNGQPVTAELEILSPGPGYDPLRATYSLFIEQALNDLGFAARAYPTDFNVLVNAVFVPDDDGNLDFDMFLLGWSLGDPALPTYHESFWAGKNDTLVNDGNNNTGFNDPDFNALVEEFNAAQTFAEAYDIMWQMEEILFTKKPYILLFDTGIIEAYRSAGIDYPFTTTLSGIQFGNGFPGIVAAAS